MTKSFTHEFILPVVGTDIDGTAITLPAGTYEVDAVEVLDEDNVDLLLVVGALPESYVFVPGAGHGLGPCPLCGGDGRIVIGYEWDGDVREPEFDTCDACHGTGVVTDEVAEDIHAAEAEALAEAYDEDPADDAAAEARAGTRLDRIEAACAEHVVVLIDAAHGARSNFEWRCSCGAGAGVATLDRAVAQRSADEHIVRATASALDLIFGFGADD